MTPQPPSPSPWIERWAHLIAPGGSVLDVAAGSGRHATWLAARGAAWSAAALALAAVFAAYQRPDLAVDLANRIWACF